MDVQESQDPQDVKLRLTASPGLATLTAEPVSRTQPIPVSFVLVRVSPSLSIA